ncbi:MAG: NADP-dependent glyceraldehyde-3-phosphate dehydrogenase [Sulfobacillus thermosulfidooxidans]|nr:MAG: NADP-dependent glyceraldehyde-3-phosphate dehydrogenase [Sulfobacillus thermosulfidooxidans]
MANTSVFIPNGADDCVQLGPQGWTSCQSGEHVAVYGPVHGQIIGKVHAFSREEVDQAIGRLQEGFQSWKRMLLTERAQLLHQWADKLEANRAELAELLMLEIAKNHRDSLDEVQRSADFIHYTAEEGLRLAGETLFGDAFPGQTRQKVSIVGRVPLGVVLAIPPFNYPINLAVTKIAPALMGGNVVVLKPPTQGAIAGLNITRLAYEAGIPDNVIIAITGSGRVIGDYLISHPRVNMINFTGSTQTGQHIASKAIMVPLLLELGGKDAAIVLADANIERARDNIVSGAFSYSGQRCTAVKRVLVVEEIADQLATAVAQKVMTLSVGAPEADSVVTPLISNEAADFVWDMIHEAVAQGAVALTPLRRDGNLIYPVVLDFVTRDMRVAWEEPFGPVLPIIRIHDAEEGVELANASEYGLQGAIFTQDVSQAFLLAEELDVGTVQINGKTSRGPDHFPFVGTKASGMGAQGVRYSLLAMTRLKSTVLNL